MKFILTIYKVNINNKLYIGSSWDFDSRKSKHKYDCYNENSCAYNCEIYKYIRENNIDWNDITIEDIYNKELDEKNNLLKRQTEQKYIDQYDSKNNGLNTRDAYTTDEQKKQKSKEYYENNKEELKQKSKDYYENNKEELKQKHKEYYENNKEYHKEYDRFRYEQNRDKILAQKRIYDNKNKEKKKEYSRKYREHKRNEKMCGEIVNELINNI